MFCQRQILKNTYRRRMQVGGHLNHVCGLVRRHVCTNRAVVPEEYISLFLHQYYASFTLSSATTANISRQLKLLHGIQGSIVVTSSQSPCKQVCSTMQKFCNTDNFPMICIKMTKNAIALLLLCHSPHSFMIGLGSTS